MKTLEEPQRQAAQPGGLPAASGYVACRLYADAERNALMQALTNAAKVDADGAPYPPDDMIYCYVESTPKTSLVSELVDELHRLGYAIRPHTEALQRPDEVGSVARSGSPAKRESGPQQSAEAPRSPAKREIDKGDSQSPVNTP